MTLGHLAPSVHRIAGVLSELSSSDSESPIFVVLSELLNQGALSVLGPAILGTGPHSDEKHVEWHGWMKFLYNPMFHVLWQKNLSLDSELSEYICV